jgi:hypothetical protein
MIRLLIGELYNLDYSMLSMFQLEEKKVTPCGGPHTHTNLNILRNLKPKWKCFDQVGSFDLKKPRRKV